MEPASLAVPGSNGQGTSVLQRGAEPEGQTSVLRGWILVGDIRIDNIKGRIERAKTYGLDPGISLRDIEYLLECIGGLL
jgi:hypothetical protein